LIVHKYGSIDIERAKRVVEGGGYRVVADIIKRLHEKLWEKRLVDLWPPLQFRASVNLLSVLPWILHDLPIRL